MIDIGLIEALLWHQKNRGFGRTEPLLSYPDLLILSRQDITVLFRGALELEQF